MFKNYLDQFPIPKALVPPKLRALLEPVGQDPTLQVEITLRWDHDHYGPNREYVHMTMAAVPEGDLSALGVMGEANNGVVSFSVPDIENQGGLSKFVPSITGYEYIVASWGGGSFYSFALSEKVWMALGLSPRVLGGEEQRIIYDDLSLPEFGVAEGEIATQYYFSSERNVRWVMSNEYLRRYLWMRGLFGVRVFFYEALLADCDELRTLMGDQSHVLIEPKDGWFRLDIREFKGELLIQVWASVVAVDPELSPEQSADGVKWPGADEPMTFDKANALVATEPVYLDDQFLERYEQSSFFDTTPVNVDGRWHCSPSYLGQWSFTESARVGRNLLKVPMRELYKPKPDREILHALSYAVEPSKIETLDLGEEHIVAKVGRFVSEILDLGDRLAALNLELGINSTAKDIVGFSREELNKNGWLSYPEISRLAQVAPLSMTEQAFLSRCKSIHELWQRVPNAILRNILKEAGHARKDIKDLASLRLLQTLSNVIERLNSDGEQVDAFGSNPEPDDLACRNPNIAALFVNNDLRISDAHDAGSVLTHLESLGFDIATVNQGYGSALDHVFDSVINGFSHLNTQLEHLLER